MSLKPFTSLVVSQRNADVLGKQPDVVYLLAPALKGGEKLDDDGNILYESGNVRFAPSAPFYTLAQLEREYGLASDGSPMAVYAKWIYDHGNFAVRCRRVVADDLAYASGILYDNSGKELLKITSESQDEFGNLLQIDVDKSDGIEAFLYTTNARYDNATRVLYINNKTYASSDLLTFEGLFAGNKIQANFFGDVNGECRLFDFSMILSAEDSAGNQFDYVDGTSALLANELTYDDLSKTLLFGSSFVSGDVKIRALLDSNELVEYVISASSANVLFDFTNVELSALYLNGIGAANDVTRNKNLRLYNNAADEATYASLSVDALGRLMLTVRGDVRSETYEFTEQMVANINLGSRLVAAESLTNSSYVPETFAEKRLTPIGFKITAYDGNSLSVYNNLQNADAAAKINSGLIRASVVGNKFALAGDVMGLRLVGGSSGLYPKLVDYLDGLIEQNGGGWFTLLVGGLVCEHRRRCRRPCWRHLCGWHHFRLGSRDHSADNWMERDHDRRRNTHGCVWCYRDDDDYDYWGASVAGWTVWYVDLRNRAS